MYSETDSVSVRMATHNENEASDVCDLASPPTKMIVLKQTYTLSDQEEMLSLAQKKFNQLRRANKQISEKARYSRVRGKFRGFNADKKKANQLLATLLYLSLMMHKVDEMKKILEDRDSSLFHEWQALLGSLHSPVFHLKERRFQNERVKKLYKRKSIYKERCETTRADLDKAQETSASIGEALSNLTKTNNQTQALLQGKHTVENDLSSAKKELEILQKQLAESTGLVESRKLQISNLQSGLKEHEVEKAKLVQLIEDNENRIGEGKDGIQMLTTTLDERDKKLANLKVKCQELEKNIEHLEFKLTKEIESHEKDCDSLRKLLAEAKNRHESTESMLNDAHTSSEDLKRKYNTDNAKSQEKIINTTRELHIVQLELKSTKDELMKTRADLDDKAKALSDAIKSVQAEADNQKELRIMIQSKDEEVKKMHEVHRQLDTKVLQAEYKCKEISTQQSITRKSLEDDIRRYEEKLSLANEENERIREREANINTLNSSQKVELEQALKSANTMEASCQRLEQFLSEQSKASEEKEDTLTKEIISLNAAIEKDKAENLHISQLMKELKENTTTNAEEAGDYKMEDRTVNVEEELRTLQMNLVTGKAEIKVLKNSNESLEKSLAEEKTKAAENEKSSNDCLTLLKSENIRLMEMINTLQKSVATNVEKVLNTQQKNDKNADDLSLKLSLVQESKEKLEAEATSLKDTNATLEQSLSRAYSYKDKWEELKKELSNMKLELEKKEQENIKLRKSCEETVVSTISSDDQQSCKKQAEALVKESIQTALRNLPSENHSM